MQTNTMKQVLGMVIGGILLVLVIFFLMRYYFVFGEGVKAGTLNYVVKKGYVFKTYEGEMILTGLQSKAPASMQSNEFTFSITDAVLAQKLMLNSGREMQLHYKEYVGSVPWRGYSKFVVDSVVMITNPVVPPGAAPVK